MAGWPLAGSDAWGYVSGVPRVVYRDANDIALWELTSGPGAWRAPA